MRKPKLFGNASPEIFKRAKELRNKMTDAEMVLWMYLRKGVNGCKFRRQHPIDCYVVDFYCHKKKLVIEVDGSIHNDPIVTLEDQLRQQSLLDWGYKILRFTNQQVLKKVESVLEEISVATK